MARRTFFWIVVALWLAVAITTAVSSVHVLIESGGAWTFYTPYPPAAPTLTQRVADLANYAQLLLFPLAAASLAVYLVLLDRDVRRASAARGFDVAAAPARH